MNISIGRVFTIIAVGFLLVWNLVLFEDFMQKWDIKRLILGEAETEFRYQIVYGLKYVDIVDVADGTSVLNPYVDFGIGYFSSNPQSANGILGTPIQSVRAYNHTPDTEFTVSLAPDIDTYGTFSAVRWRDTAGVSDYRIQAMVADDGRLNVDPSAGVITSDTGCSTDSSNIVAGSVAYFLNDVVNPFNNVESIDLMLADGNVSHCRYDIQGVDMHQRVPASQSVGVYRLEMVLSIT